MIDQKVEIYSLEERERQALSAQYADENLAKIILAVSAGAFGVSITFFISKEDSLVVYEKLLLMISWISLAICIGAQATAYFFQRKVCEKIIRVINFNIQEGLIDTMPSYNKLIESLKDLPDYIKTRKLDKIAMIAFLFGLFTLLLFSIFVLY